MKEYVPEHVGTVTRYIVVESFDIRPADLAIRGYEISKGAIIKETCFGLTVMGKKDEVDRITETLRKEDPAHIFVKDRGFPPGDARRCRSGLGGARPGFHGIEFEMTVLPYISHGIEAADKGRTTALPLKDQPLEHPTLSIHQLKKIIDSQEP